MSNNTTYNENPLAILWLRFCASSIDIGFFLLLYIPIATVLAMFWDISNMFKGGWNLGFFFYFMMTLIGDFPLSIFVISASIIIYLICVKSKKQATFGQRWMHLYMARTNGHSVNFLQAICHFLLTYLPIIIYLMTPLYIEKTSPVPWETVGQYIAKAHNNEKPTAAEQAAADIWHAEPARTRAINQRMETTIEVYYLILICGIFYFKGKSTLPDKICNTHISRGKLPLVI